MWTLVMALPSALPRSMANPQPGLANALEREERSGAWLGRQLHVSRMTVNRWIHGDLHMSSGQVDEAAKLLNTTVKAIRNGRK